jgi:GTPase SAR1 family protein
MFTKRTTVALVFGTSIVISGVVALSTLSSANSGVLNFLSTILAASVIGLGSISLKPVRNFLEAADRPLDPSVLTLYLFGQAGSGKTTLIKNFFTAEELGVERSTEEFVYYNNIEVCVDVETGKRIKVHTADYKGEKPSQAIVSISPDFIGKEGDRRVNAIILIVDVAPRYLNREGKVLTDNELLKLYKTDAEGRILKRVQEHTEYISKPILQILFATVYGERLHSVRLLINKIDLIEKMIEKGYLPDLESTQAEPFTRKLFTEIEDNIRAACEANQITDFATYVVSETQGTNMGLVRSELIRSHMDAIAHSGGAKS